MARCVIETVDAKLEIDVNESGKVDDYNLAVAIVKCIKAYDGAFVRTYGSTLTQNVLELIKQTNKKPIPNGLSELP